VAVTTYHYDNFRTGWNNNETTLSAANFPSNFGILQTVTLDDQVDAQPLVVPGQTIAGGTHDVVYVATESNSIYAIDANSGAILVHTNLGSPVPTPLSCNNNGPNVGITSTPVIDLSTNTLYAMAYVNGSSPMYQLHALNLDTLADLTGSPVTVAASHTLTNGSTFTFNAQYERQRTALLEMNGNIYAGFGGFCDFAANVSRGWVLGWNASTLAPLPANQLNDTQATSPTSFFLSSVWMSGYGLAGDGTKLYFATGNSDCNYFVSPEVCPSTTTYNGTTNIQESVVALNSNLSFVGTFTPTNVLALDQGDLDTGSGGVLALPSQSGSYPDLAVAGGKAGILYLLNRDAMSSGGYNSAAVLDSHQLGSCWCGPSYFVGSDGVSRIVSSMGTDLSDDGLSVLSTWQLQLSPSPHLVQEGTAPIPPNGQDTVGQDDGFFTVVSSNGTLAGSAIIWGVMRPTTTTNLTLYAFAAQVSNATYQQLFSSSAGSWPNTTGNANVVPVVANGMVYVASNQALTIFGVPSGSAAVAAVAKQIAPPPPARLKSPHVVTGKLLSINGSMLTLQTRAGFAVTIDGSLAAEKRQVAVLKRGTPYMAQGSSLNAAGILRAESIARAKVSSRLWPPDR
jgi:hypothetical protein